jgi:hypothetical protein
MATINIAVDTAISALAYAAGDTLNIQNTAILDWDVNPANQPLTIQSTDRGKLTITNASTTTPRVVRLSSNTGDLIFNGNSQIIARGDWIQVGTGTGLAGQTINLSTVGGVAIDSVPFLRIEDGAGGYDIYTSLAGSADVGGRPLSSVGTGELGKHYNQDNTTKIVTFGDGTNGNVIASGRKIYVPNIFFTSATYTATTANKNFLDLNPTGYASLWVCAFTDRFYLNSQSSTHGGIDFKDVGCHNAFGLGSSVYPVTIDGLYSAMENGVVSATCSISSNAGTVSVDNVVVAVATGAGNIDGFTMTNSNLVYVGTIKCVHFQRNSGNRNGMAITAARNLNGITYPRIKKLIMIGAKLTMDSWSDCTVQEVLHSDATNGVANATNPTNALNIVNCARCSIELLTGLIGACRNQITNVDASTSDFCIAAVNYDPQANSDSLLNSAGVNVRVGNVAAHASDYRVNVNAQQAVGFRTFIKNARNPATKNLNACSYSKYEWVSAADMSTSASGIIDYGPYALVLTAATGNGGKLILGPFTQDTSSGFLTLTGSPYFNQLGAIFFPAGGDVATWVCSQIRGVASFDSSAPTFTLTEATPGSLAGTFKMRNYGDTVWGSTYALTFANLQTALAALTGYNSSVGFDISFTATATGADATRNLSKIVIACQKDPAYTPVIRYTGVGHSGLQTGTRVVILTSGDALVDSILETTGTAEVQCPYTYALVQETVKRRAYLYGYLPTLSTVLYATQDIVDPLTQLVDEALTVTNPVTVAAYTDLTDIDKMYDYLQYFVTTAAGWEYGQIVTAEGTDRNFGSYNIVLDATAAQMVSITGSTITLKCTALASGTKGVNFVTTGTLTLANGATIDTTTYTTSTGRFVKLGIKNAQVASDTPVYPSDATIGVTVAVLSGEITGMTLTDAGTGYLPSYGVGDPYYTGAGSGFALNITSVDGGGAITGWALADGGQDYTVGEFLNIAGGNEDAYFQITSVGNGAITGLSVVAGGTQYRNNDLVPISGGTGGVARLEVYEGVVIDATIEVAGTGYSSGTRAIVGTNNLNGSTTRYFLKNLTDDIVLANAITTTAAASQYILYTADKTIECRVEYVYRFDANTNFHQTATLTNAGLIFDVQGGEDDLVYINNGFDGPSIVDSGEFTADGTNLECDIDDADNQTTVQRIYAWYKAYLTTADGIENFWDAITAKDAANYAIDDSVVALQFDNKKTTLLTISGGSISNISGSLALVSPTTTGSINFNPGDSPAVQVWTYPNRTTTGLLKSPAGIIIPL